MPSRTLQDRFSGPYCSDCDDRGTRQVPGPCGCRDARCIMPRCSMRVASSSHVPVPVTLLIWRVQPAGLKSEMIVTPGWACGPACLFGYARALQDGPDQVAQAKQAAEALNGLQAAYFDVAPTAKHEPHIDPRIWDVIANDQLQTIREAAKYAHMASVP